MDHSASINIHPKYRPRKDSTGNIESPSKVMLFNLFHKYNNNNNNE